MPQVEAIQILLKTKMVGSENISNAINQIANLSKVLANLKPAEIIKESINEVISKLKESENDVVEQNKKVNQIIDNQARRTFDDLEEYVTKFGKLASTVFGAFSSWMVFNKSLPAIKELYQVSNGIIPNAEKIISLFREGKTITAFLTGVTSIGVVFAKATSFIPTLLISKYVAYSAFESVKGILGLAPRGVSFLERANRLVVSIDDGLTKSYVNAGKFIQPLTIGLSTITGLVTGLISTTTGFLGGFAFITSLGSILSSQIDKIKLRISAGLGNGKSRLVLTFNEFRDLAYNLLDEFKGKANSVLVLGKKFKDSFALDPNNTKKFTSEVNSLSAIRFPMAQQIPLVMAEIRPFLNFAIKQLSVITNTLFKGFNLSKTEIDAIEKNTDGALKDIQNKSRISFGVIHKELKNAFDVSALGRWWQTSKIAEPIKLPFALVGNTLKGVSSIAKGTFSLLASGASLIGKNLFSKTSKPEAVTTDNQAKIDDKKPIIAIKSIREFGVETMKFLAGIIKLLNVSMDSLIQKWKDTQKGIAEKSKPIVTPIEKAKSSIVAPVVESSKEAGKEAGKAFISSMAPTIEAGGQAIKGAIQKMEKAAITTPIPAFTHTGPAMPKSVVFADAAKQELSEAQQIAKKGGQGIVKEVAAGVTSNIPVLTKAMSKATEAADKFLPHSPAEEGAFKTLREAGAKIIDELTFGLASKIPFLVAGFFKLSKLAVDAMKPMIEVGHIAERSGVAVETFSSLQHAFSGFEVSASDLQMSFTSLNKSLNEVASTEKQAALSAIGVNLAKARESANPTMEIFLQLSDAMKTFPPNSVKMQKALESLGISTQGNLINAMSMGREEIIKMMGEGAKIGATFDESFVKTGHAFTTTVNKISKIGEYLERDFLQAMIGPLKTAAEKFWTFYTENAVTIRGFVKIAGEVFNIILDMIGQFTQRALENPEKAIEFFVQSLMVVWQGFLNFMGAAVNDLVDGILGNIWGWMKSGLMIVWNILKEYVYQFASFFGRIFDLWVKKGKIKILEFVDSIVNNRYMRAYLEPLGLIDKANNIRKSLDEERANFYELEQKTAESPSTATDIVIDVAYKTQGFIEQAKKEMAENAEGLADPKKWEETKARFSTVFSQFRKDMQGIADSTGFGDILAEGFKKFDKAVSQQNWDAAKNEMQGLSDKAKEVVDGLGKIGPAAERSAQQMKEAAEKEKLAAKEMAQNEVKIKTLTLQTKLQATLDASEREQIQREIDLQAFITAQQEELTQFQQALDAKYGAEAENQEKIKALKEFKVTQQAALSNKQNQNEEQSQAESVQRSLAITSKFADGFQTLFANMYELSGRKVKEFFYMEKAAAIAQAIVNTGLAVIRAWSEGGPFFGPALAGLAAATGATQIGIITQTAIAGPSGYNKGGMIPGEGDRDTVPAWLTPGEAVINKHSVQKYGSAFLNALNQGLIPERAIENLSLALPSPIMKPQTAFSGGGFAMPIPPTQQTKQEVNIINVTSPAEVEKVLYSSAGKKAILNILASENNKVRKIVNNT